MVLLGMQGFYVAWQMVMVSLNVVLYTWVTNAGLLFYFCESFHRWASGGNILRRWRLRRLLHLTCSYSEFAQAARQLDDLDGRKAWRESPSGYAATAVADTTRQLREAREAENAEAR